MTGGLAVGLVGEDLLSAGAGEDVDGRGEGEGWAVAVGGVLPKEDALGSGPPLGDRWRGFEDKWGVGKERAVPEIGAAAFDEVEIVSLEIEAEGGAGFVLAVDGDEVLRVELRADALG